MFKIIRREEMAGGTVILNEIEAPMIARKAKPGQFVILKANEAGERIPLTMAETDPEEGTITVIYMVVGKSTALFKSLEAGQAYQDVIGPLGRATHLEKVGTVVCVGGGDTSIITAETSLWGIRAYLKSVFGFKINDILIYLKISK